MRKVKVGIIGFGFSGSTFHAPVISAVPGMELSCICTTDPGKAKSLNPHVAIVSTPSELFADPSIDLVVITSPNKFHFPLVLQALQAGKHVVVEKPFVITVEEGKELIAKARKVRRLLSVYHNRRWDNDFVELRRLISNQELGDLHYYEANYHRFSPDLQGGWREQQAPGSGTIYDLGSHLIDQALILFGTPVAIWADMFAQRAIGAADDYFHIQLHYGNTRVVLQSRMLERGSYPRYLVHGSKASLLLYGTDPQEVMLRQGIHPLSEAWIQCGAESRGTLIRQQDVTEQQTLDQIELYPGSYSSYYEGMYRSVVYGDPLPVSAEEALETINLIETAQLSSTEGRIIPYQRVNY